MGANHWILLASCCFAVGIAQYMGEYQQQNQIAPYGNYSSGMTYNKAYNSSMPLYPPQVNQSASPYYMRNASYQSYYAADPWAWQWDKEHRGRQVYEINAHAWVQANIQAAWDFAVQMVDGKNMQYYSQPQCGYGGNPYDSTETRNQKRGEILTQMAQWLWDTYPDQNKQPLHNAMNNLNAYEHPVLRDCLAENYDPWKGTCSQYTKYSRPDQMCNNWEFPNWGAYDDIGVRITDIWNYDGGIYKKMKGWQNYDGSMSPLMNEKQLADILDRTNSECYNFDTTHLHALFAQFTTHDLVHSAPYTVTGQYGQQVKPTCCGGDQSCLHHACNPVIGQGNGYDTNYYCMEMSDNVPGIDGCHPQAKDPRNQQTAYLDASHIYGPTCEKAAQLRSFRKGKLKVNKGYYGLYSRNINLPDDPNPDYQHCDTNYPNNDLRCFMAGDKRVNQHPGMTMMHTLWLRLHNRVSSSCAKYLEKNSLAEDVVDEICYQETRRFIQGVLQNIFYRDHLVVELGNYVARNPTYGLNLDVAVPYNPYVHASIWPEYTYAAGRLHTTVSHWTQVNNPDLVAQGWQEPHSWYKVTDFLGKGYQLAYSKKWLNELFGNSLYDPEQCYDTSFVPEFRGGWGGPGLDMFAINIARQREFGIPWYWQMRDFCGMGKVWDWSQLQGIFHQHCLNVLPGIYGSVQNIEGYVGMICELPMPDALVGPTAGCILQRQYQNIREGDRWFFDRIGFTPDQVNVIKKFDMGKVLCITSNLDYVTENVFRTPNPNSNKFVTCNVYDDITEDDLTVLWTTLPTYPADYRTCKEYGPAYGGQSYAGGYQNQTYAAGGNMYGNNTYGQPYQAPQQQQYKAPAY